MKTRTAKPKRGRGRPQKAASDRMNKRWFRCTDADWASAVQAAERLGTTVSDLVRRFLAEQCKMSDGSRQRNK